MLSGLPVGSRWSCSRRSVPGSMRHAEIVWRDGRHHPRRPSQEVALGADALGEKHPADPRLAVRSVEPSGFAGRIEMHDGMVQHPRIARPELYRAHVSRPLSGNRHDELPEDIRAVGGHVERLAHAHHEVRLAELPPPLPVGRRRKIGAIPARRAARHPPLDCGSLGVGETAIACKRAVARLRRPRRHRARGGDVGDLARAPLHVFIGDQTERPDFPRPMTGRAAGKHDRRDVAGERDLRGRVRRAGVRNGRGNCGNAERVHAHAGSQHGVGQIICDGR